MKIRFAVPITLAPALVFFVVISIGAPAQAQRPGEHPGGERHDNVHANHGRIPEPPAHRDVHAKPEIDRRPGGRLAASLTFRKTTGTATMVPMTSVTSLRIPIHMAASNISPFLSLSRRPLRPRRTPLLAPWRLFV